MNFIYIFTLFSISTMAQSLPEETGVVSYISSQNIYIKFENTEGITKGDTLYLKIYEDAIPAVLAQYISSTSIAGKTLTNTKININDKLIAFVREPEYNEEKEVSSDIRIKVLNNEDKRSENKETKIEKISSTAFKGKISIQSYSGLSNYNNYGDYQRWRYNLSLSADEISGSNFSFSNYMSFSYRTREWETIKNNLFGNLRIYDFALNYEFNPGSIIWFGRHLNSKITNISSIDGIQYEAEIARTNYSFGVVAGARPDFNNMGFNLKLFEFGGYFSRSDTTATGFMENTIAVMQQTNNFIIDRRFFYFQHNNTIIPGLNLFLSSEIDLYKKVDGESKNDFSLTGLYFSARYAPLRIMSFSLSYDARKNVIYYETFKNYIETLIENETRQGLRGGISIRPFNRLFLNLNAGYRFSKKDIKPSKNFSGYISYSVLPYLEITPSLSYTRLIANYLDGNTFEFRISKDVKFLNSYLSLGYQEINYTFTYNSENLIQNIFLADISFRLLKKMFLNIDFEGTFQENHTDSRIIIGITQRF